MKMRSNLSPKMCQQTSVADNQNPGAATDHHNNPYVASILRQCTVQAAKRNHRCGETKPPKTNCAPKDASGSLLNNDLV